MGMHEYSVTESVLAMALEKASQVGASKIIRINLVVGELSGIVSECVQFYFDVISQNTMASGAQLSFAIRPTRLRCTRCREVFVPRRDDLACPACGEPAGEIIGGRECFLESIEVE